MAVNLADYVTSLQYEINPPGQNLYPSMNNTEAVGRLVDAFWELRLSGLDFLAGYDCDITGVITANSNVGQTVGFNIPADWFTDDGVPDLGREVVQAIVLFAGYRIALTAAQNLATSVRSQAGPVSFETQKSAQLQQQVLKNLVAKIDIVLTRLSDLGTTSVMVLDQVMEKTAAEATDYWAGPSDYGQAWWPR